MKPALIFLSLLTSLSLWFGAQDTAPITLAQEDIKAKNAAYYLCADHVNKDPHKAYEYCSEYLKKYPNGNESLIAYAGKFVPGYKKISQYIKSVPMTYFAEQTARWAVYSPGLQATIPTGESLGSSFRITKVYRGEVGGKFIYLSKSSLVDRKAVDLKIGEGHKYLVLLRPSERFVLNQAAPSLPSRKDYPRVGKVTKKTFAKKLFIG